MYVFDEFEESVLMSTYLVAYMVSDFAYIESNNHFDNVTLRIIVRNDVVNQTNHAIELVPLVLKYFKNYFNIDFPLSKLDLAAIPHFELYSEENFGLITFRQVKIYDNNYFFIF